MNEILETKTIESLKNELESLIQLVIYEYIANFYVMLKNNDFETFEKAVKRAQRFRKWLVIKTFLDQIKNEKNLPDNIKQKAIEICIRYIKVEKL